jgi:hypothetical protein
MHLVSDFCPALYCDTVSRYQAEENASIAFLSTYTILALELSVLTTRWMIESHTR